VDALSWCVDAAALPFTQFTADVAAGTVPKFSLVVPKLCNDAHDCSIGTADTRLAANMPPLVASPAVQHDGLLIVVFDEAGCNALTGEAGSSIVGRSLGSGGSRCPLSGHWCYRMPM